MSMILLSHGSGGQKSHQLITETILPRFKNPILEALDDQGLFTLGASRLAMSTDSYVVDPLFFPGGDIGKLAIHGTVNDLAVSGARPLYLTVGFILEEGLPLEDFERILDSMREAAEEAGVQVITGDTKVVPRGKADRIFINTAGVGILEGAEMHGSGIRPGDKILLSGTIADHGMAVMAAREGLPLAEPIRSDTAPLHGLIREVLKVAKVSAMRDPTRGGVATTLKELALQSGVNLTLEETQLPIRPPVAALCEMLGFDPLHVANEGKVLLFVAPEDAPKALEAMRHHPYGREAAIIGEASEGVGDVVLRTAIGGKRFVDMLVGQQLPRIC